MGSLHNRAIRRRRQGQRGFTLIELLVVIAILSVLATIVILNVTGVKNQGNAAACKTDVQTTQTAVDEYVAAQPSGLGHFSGATSTPTNIQTVDGTVTQDLVPTYMQSAPTSCDHAGTPWGNIDVALNGGDLQVSGTYS
jgi:prepilin-type N-terminal cleavage/methylation domain-containing protein